MKSPTQFQVTNIIQIVTCLFLTLAIWFFNKEKSNKYVTDPELTREMRKANEEKREWLLFQSESAEKTAAYLRERDSLQNVKLDKNLSEIKKLQNKSNEKINVISRYGSADLVRAFAEFEDK